jgi:hypothetical protein
MGSPLFIASPVIAQAIVPTLTGGAVDPIDDATKLVEASGATLIETIEWAIDQAGLDVDYVDAGQIAICLDDGSARNVWKYIESEDWDNAVEVAAFNRAIDVSLVLPDGWSIYVSHNLQSSAWGAPDDIDLTFTARGGVVG